MRTSFLLIALTFTVLSCGDESSEPAVVGGGGSAVSSTDNCGSIVESCHSRGMLAGKTMQDKCYELSANGSWPQEQLDSDKKSCETEKSGVQGVFRAGPCENTSSAVGGCFEHISGGCVTNWFFPDAANTSTAKSDCEAKGALWKLP